MLITCLGHSMFLIETADGVRIITDPTDAYPVTPAKADYVLISHHHHDHDCMDAISDCSSVLDKPEHTFSRPGLRCDGFASWHDDAQGTKRGPNTIWRIQTDGLTLVHLGDLGHIPDSDLIKAIGPVDVLMIPVGGFFTIDAAQAHEVADLLKARVILPMHHRTNHIASWPIAPADDFIARYPSGDVSRQPLLRVTAGDIACVPHVVLLEAALKG